MLVSEMGTPPGQSSVGSRELGTPQSKDESPQPLTQPTSGNTCLLPGQGWAHSTGVVFITTVLVL